MQNINVAYKKYVVGSIICLVFVKYEIFGSKNHYQVLTKSKINRIVSNILLTWRVPDEYI